jgi:hypothetical protein
MMVSLDGLLIQASDSLVAQSDGGLAYAVRELLGNLTELRDRTEQGDYTALDEFFAIYVVTEKEAYKRSVTGR